MPYAHPEHQNINCILIIGCLTPPLNSAWQEIQAPKDMYYVKEASSAWIRSCLAILGVHLHADQQTCMGIGLILTETQP